MTGKLTRMPYRAPAGKLAPCWRPAGAQAVCDVCRRPARPPHLPVAGRRVWRGIYCAEHCPCCAPNGGPNAAA